MDELILKTATEIAKKDYSFQEDLEFTPIEQLTVLIGELFYLKNFDFDQAELYDHLDSLINPQ